MNKKLIYSAWHHVSSFKVTQFTNRDFMLTRSRTCLANHSSPDKEKSQLPFNPPRRFAEVLIMLWISICTCILNSVKFLIFLIDIVKINKVLKHWRRVVKIDEFSCFNCLMSSVSNKRMSISISFTSAATLRRTDLEPRTQRMADLRNWS